MKKIISGALLSIAALPALAHTDLLNENFDGYTWTDNFSTLELDRLPPASGINSLFINGDGVSQPWWPVKDSTSSTDRFCASHSYYQSPGTSNDWLTSGAMTIPTEGFVLSFGAQSLPIRSGDAHALSDLWIFVTEKPVTSDWQPSASDATFLIEAVPYGKSRDNCEGDFIPYEYSLDEYAGKTVYITFANLNTDKDILCIDDILVRRYDLAEVSATAPDYIINGDFNVNATIKGTSEQGLGEWTLTFKCGDVTKSESGDKLENGQTIDFTFTAPVGPDQKADYTVTLSSDGIKDIVAAGTTHGLLFQTTRRTMVEETTGVWCGNCPTAMYTIESLESDPAYEGRILPVSVHVGNDPMAEDNYEYMFGIGAVAPFFRVDRALTLIGINNNDFVYDPTNDKSAAYGILEYLAKEALLDMEVSGKYLKNQGKITGVDVTLEYTPAITLDGTNMRIGFILTENNVHMDNMSSQLWWQHNYLAHDPSVGAQNPFYHMPEVVPNMYFQDVARSISSFHGAEGSVPATELKAGEKVTYNTQIGVPSTRATNDKGEEIIPEIDTRNLYLTAFIIDGNTDACMNAVRVPLSDEAEPKVTLEQIKESLGVESISADSDGEAVYYNLQGMRVAEPTAGIYIVKCGSKVTKEIIR